MLILSESDILNAIDFDELLKSVEHALLLQETGEYFMPDRIHLEYNGNIQLLMPAFTKNHFSTKIVSVFPENKKRDKPTILGVVILNDGQTGEPLALLNGSKLTALRTGAVGALGLAYTSPKNLSSLGLIGAGIQGFHQVLFACTVRNITQVNIHDPYHKNLSAFIDNLSVYLPGINIKEIKEVGELIQLSEAIVTATTSLSPVIPLDKNLTEGKHFIGIGSYTPGMQEYPEELFRYLDTIFIDTPLAKKESGDIAIPLQKGLITENQIHTLGKLINGKVKIDVSKTTFFKSVGMALFDLMTADAIYQNAKNKGIGQKVNF